MFFVSFLKLFRTFYIYIYIYMLLCKDFLKVDKKLVKKRFAKYLSADGCFVKLLTVMITTMLSVS